MRSRRLFAVLLTTMLVLVALAGQCWAGQVFSDVPVGHWAEKDLAEMKAKGIVSGFSDGYHPDEQLTREQAVIMLLRAVGLEDQNPTQTLQQLVGSTAVTAWYNDVSSWAQSPLAVAVERDILTTMDKQNFRPGDAIKRYELAVLAARAMGLTQEAQTAYGTGLSFTDASQIPDWASGYVKLMVDKRIITGYPDNTFKPNDLLTRVQMAAILARIDDTMDTAAENVVFGEVISSGGYAGSLQITDRAGQQRTFSFTPDVFVYDGRYDNNEQLPVTALMQGHKVELVLGSSGSIVYAEIVPADAFVSGEEVQGIIVSVSSIGRSVTIASDGQKVSYGVAQDAMVRVNSVSSSLDSVLGGQKVTATVRQGSVVALNASDNSWTLSGIVREAGAAYVTVADANGIEFTFNVTLDTSIEVEGDHAELADILAGQEVKVTATNLQAQSIEAEESRRRLEGTVTATELTPRWTITIEDEDGIKETFTVDSRCDIERDNREVGFSDITVGDFVELRVVNNLVTDIEAEVQEGANEGTVVSINFSVGTSKITIEDGNGREYTYDINSQTKIRKDRKSAELKDVDIGDYAELEIEGSIVVEMEVEEKIGVDHEAGEIVNILSRADMIVIEPADGEPEVLEIFMEDAYIYSGGDTIDLDDLDEGDYIVATGEMEGGIMFAEEVIVVSQ